MASARRKKIKFSALRETFFGKRGRKKIASKLKLQSRETFFGKCGRKKNCEQAAGLSSLKQFTCKFFKKKNFQFFFFEKFHGELSFKLIYSVPASMIYNVHLATNQRGAGNIIN